MKESPPAAKPHYLGTEGADGMLALLHEFSFLPNQIPPALLADCRRAFTSSATTRATRSGTVGWSSGETYWQGAGATFQALEALALKSSTFT